MFNLYTSADRTSILRWWLGLILICSAATSVYAQETTKSKSVMERAPSAGGQQTDNGKLTIRPIRTDSPRHTLKSFLSLRHEMEQTL
jgi:hypothetical protein